MRARDVMTTDVISVGPETSVTDLAQLILDRRISGTGARLMPRVRPSGRGSRDSGCRMLRTWLSSKHRLNEHECRKHKAPSGRYCECDLILFQHLSPPPAARCCCLASNRTLRPALWPNVASMSPSAQCLLPHHGRGPASAHPTASGTARHDLGRTDLKCEWRKRRQSACAPAIAARIEPTGLKGPQPPPRAWRSSPGRVRQSSAACSHRHRAPRQTPPWSPAGGWRARAKWHRER